MKKRYIAPLVLLAFIAGNLTYSAVTGDSEKQLLKLSFCVNGVMPTVGTTGFWTTTVQNIHWGPEDFPMSVHAVSVPGFIAGYTTAPYCPNSSEAQAVEEILKNSG